MATLEERHDALERIIDSMLELLVDQLAKTARRLWAVQLTLEENRHVLRAQIDEKMQELDDEGTLEQEYGDSPDARLLRRARKLIQDKLNEAPGGPPEEPT